MFTSLEMPHHSVIQYFLLVCGGVLSFLPFFCNLFKFRYLGLTPDTELLTLSSSWASVATLSLLVPLVADWLIDFKLKGLSASSTSGQSRREFGGFLNVCEMLLVIGGLATPSLLTIADPYAVDKNICARVFRCVLVVGTICASFSRIDSHFWPRWVVIGAMLLFVLSQVFQAFHEAFRSSGDSRAFAFYVLWMATASVAIVVFYTLCSIWGYFKVIGPLLSRNRVGDETIERGMTLGSKSKLVLSSSKSPQPPRQPATRSRKKRLRSARGDISDAPYASSVADSEDGIKNEDDLDGLYWQMFVSLGIACLTIIFIASLNEYQDDDHNMVASTLTDCAYILVEVLLLVLTMRKAKSEVVSGLVSSYKYYIVENVACLARNSCIYAHRSYCIAAQAPSFQEVNHPLHVPRAPNSTELRRGGSPAALYEYCSGGG
jgi:hypothetical protein